MSQQDKLNFKKVTSLCLLSATLLLSQSSWAKGKTIILKKAKKVQSKNISLVKKASVFNKSLLGSNFVGWGIDPKNKKSSINLTQAWNGYRKKKEVVVAVVDTGIDPTHPFLKDNIHVSNGIVNKSNYGIDFAKNKKSKTAPFDGHGHGTHVSGIIKSVFPQVKIVALKYYDKNASGQDNLNSTIKALEYAVNQNVDIINYSGGGPEPSLEELRILKIAERKGILIVAAAGNEESNIDQRANAYYPASYGLKNIITVTAHDQNIRTLNSSNWGIKSVDISAPGYRIKSALPKGRAGYLTGTSQATAFVSGAAALIMSQYPNLTTEEVKNIINKSAKKEKSLLTKCSSGGRLDLSNAHRFAASLTLKKYTKRTVATRSYKKAN
jgi:subtilisin family serine protease